MVKPIIDLLNYSRANKASWFTFLRKFRDLKQDAASPAIVASAMAKYEKYTENNISAIIDSIYIGAELNSRSQAWLRSLSPDRSNDLDHVQMMNSISATAEDDVLRKLYKFRELVLDRLFLSEAEVERVFSAHMNIHIPCNIPTISEYSTKLSFSRIFHNFITAILFCYHVLDHVQMMNSISATAEDDVLRKLYKF